MKRWIQRGRRFTAAAIRLVVRGGNNTYLHPSFSFSVHGPLQPSDVIAGHTPTSALPPADDLAQQRADALPQLNDVVPQLRPLPDYVIE